MSRVVILRGFSLSADMGVRILTYTEIYIYMWINANKR